MYIKEIILILDKKKTKKRSKEICKILGKKNKIIKKIYQTKPKLGGALINGIELSKGSHILIMSSDLETDPSSVKKMLKKSIISLVSTFLFVAASLSSSNATEVNLGGFNGNVSTIVTHGFSVRAEENNCSLLWKEAIASFFSFRGKNQLLPKGPSPPCTAQFGW